jgi:ketosteroid isomerase-like protein
MSAALELVKIALQAYGAGDCEITVQLCDPMVRWDERASRPDGDLVWKQDEVLAAMQRYRSGWEEYRFEVEKIAEVGPGRIVGLCRERGKSGDGIPVDRRYGGLWVVEDGKIASWATYLTPKEAVGAARELGGAPDEENGRQRPEPVPGSAARPPGRSPQPAGKRPKPPQPATAAAGPRPSSEAGTSKGFTEKQRQAAKRRAALARAARQGGRRAPTG